MIWRLFSRTPRLWGSPSRLSDDQKRAIRSYLAAPCPPETRAHRRAFVRQAYQGYADLDAVLDQEAR